MRKPSPRHNRNARLPLVFSVWLVQPLVCGFDRGIMNVALHWRNSFPEAGRTVYDRSLFAFVAVLSFASFGIAASSIRSSLRKSHQPGGIGRQDCGHYIYSQDQRELDAETPTQAGRGGGGGGRGGFGGGGRGGFSGGRGGFSGGRGGFSGGGGFRGGLIPGSPAGAGRGWNGGWGGRGWNGGWGGRGWNGGWGGRGWNWRLGVVSWNNWGGWNRGWGWGGGWGLEVWVGAAGVGEAAEAILLLLG